MDRPSLKVPVDGYPVRGPKVPLFQIFVKLLFSFIYKKHVGEPVILVPRLASNLIVLLMHCVLVVTHN